MRAAYHVNPRTGVAFHASGRFRAHSGRDALRVIKNGDTIGRDANERIRVEYAPSTLEREGNVMRLVYEPARKKRGWWPF